MLTVNDKTRLATLDRCYTKAKEGEAEYQFKVGLESYLGEIVERDIDVALSWFKAAADQGYEEAYYYLALCYEETSKVEHNEELAFNYFKKSIDTVSCKNIAAYSKLAECYKYGRGCAIDEAKALEYYQEGAHVGDPASSFALAMMYLDNKDKEHYPDAVDLLRKCINQFPEANYYLGQCHEYGNGTTIDIYKAFQAYNNGASLDEPRCCYEAARCYDYGVGTRTDKRKAQELYQKAKDAGIEGSKKGMKHLKKTAYEHQRVDIADYRRTTRQLTYAAIVLAFLFPPIGCILGIVSAIKMRHNFIIKNMILSILAIVIGALLTIIVSYVLINDVQTNFFILDGLLHLKHSLMGK